MDTGHYKFELIQIDQEFIIQIDQNNLSWIIFIYLSQNQIKFKIELNRLNSIKFFRLVWFGFESY